MPDPCPFCDSSGMRLIERPDGPRGVRECDCRAERRQLRQAAAARIPDRYTHCTLDDYEPKLRRRQRLPFEGARDGPQLCSEPLTRNGRQRPSAHRLDRGRQDPLAIGILRALMQERGALGLFYDYRDLLKQIQNSYNGAAGPSEMEILRPAFKAEVLVLDELGAGKPTEWVWETVAHVLNTRYNDRRTTILTTNYANLPPAGFDPQSSVTAIRVAAREQTLGDRMRSRLQEKSVPVEMTGTDFRQRVRRAAYASWAS